MGQKWIKYLEAELTLIDKEKMMKRIRETSIESYINIKKNLSDRKKLCLSALCEKGEMTANELAMYLYSVGDLPYFNRNFVHPRLTELLDDGLIKISKTKIDGITNRRCSVYEVI